VIRMKGDHHTRTPSCFAVDRAWVWFVQPPRRFRLDRGQTRAATLRRVGSAATVPAVVSPVSPVVSPVFSPV
jgi:hypothetical protein